MATQKVTEKIIQDAKKEAEEILDKFKEEADKIKDEYSKRTAAKRTQIEAEVEAVKTCEILRILSQNRLEFNKKFIQKKRTLVNDIIGNSLKELHTHQEYLNFLKSLIKKSGDKAGDLLINKQDMKRYGTELEKFIKKEGLKYKIKADDEITGGLIIKKGKTTYLGSLDLIGELLNDELTIAISQILY